MSEFLKKLYADYLKPEIEAAPRGEYSEALSVVENEINCETMPEYAKAAEFISIRSFVIGLTVGRELKEYFND